MATVTLRVPDAVRDELDHAARARGISISDLLRDAIDDLLGWRDGAAPGRDREANVVVPKTLDVVHRRLFALLHDILRESSDDEDDQSYHKRLSEIMMEGYAGEYFAEFGHMPAEMTPAECERLEDILEMFRTLEVSFARLAPADRERLGAGAEHVLTFDGLDMNRSDEARMLVFARHLVKDEDRWEDFRERLTAGERGNSHSPRLGGYLRMVPVYKSIRDRIFQGNARGRDGDLFTADDLLGMIQAAQHPLAER
jgi:hypothetical protein